MNTLNNITEQRRKKIKNSEFTISYDLPNEKWHIMEIPTGHNYSFNGIKAEINTRNYTALNGTLYDDNVIICKCSYNYFDLINYPLDTFPDGAIFKNDTNDTIVLSEIFKYKKVCLGCKRKVNLKDFKQWMVLQKFKYL